MSVCWRGAKALLVPASVVVALALAAPSVARAESSVRPAGPDVGSGPSGLLEARRVKPTKSQPRLYGFGDKAAGDSLDGVSFEGLERLAGKDFHPETDRWTERNNRIKISLFGCGWFFSENLNIAHDGAVGLRVAWEVPGFVAIRLDSAVAAWAHLLARIPNVADRRGFSDTLVPGFINNTSLTIGIFNPELSTPAGPLAWWAGFGPEIWVFNFHDNNVFVPGSQHTVDFQTINLGFQLFLEMDFKVHDLVHVGIGYKTHILFASQVKDGRYWDLDGGNASLGSRDNNGIAAIQDVYVQLSVLF